jgi:hypothetical protein
MTNVLIGRYERVGHHHKRDPTKLQVGPDSTALEAVIARTAVLVRQARTCPKATSNGDNTTDDAPVDDMRTL